MPQKLSLLLFIEVTAYLPVGLFGGCVFPMGDLDHIFDDITWIWFYEEFCGPSLSSLKTMTIDNSYKEGVLSVYIGCLRWLWMWLLWCGWRHISGGTAVWKGKRLPAAGLCNCSSICFVFICQQILFSNASSSTSYPGPKIPMTSWLIFFLQNHGPILNLIKKDNKKCIRLSSPKFWGRDNMFIDQWPWW